jgi:hypothetical protein
MKVGFEEEKTSIISSYNEKFATVEQEKQSLHSTIFDLAIMNRFATHPYFSGEKPLTIYSPDDAKAIFGHRFKVEIIDGKAKEVALDEKGKPLMSKKNHGEQAEFDEAIQIMVEAKNKTHNIMASASGRGPRNSHNLGDGDDDTNDKSSNSLIKSGLKKRKAQFMGA